MDPAIWYGLPLLRTEAQSSLDPLAAFIVYCTVLCSTCCSARQSACLGIVWEQLTWASKLLDEWTGLRGIASLILAEHLALVQTVRDTTLCWSDRSLHRSRAMMKGSPVRVCIHHHWRNTLAPDTKKGANRVCVWPTVAGVETVMPTGAERCVIRGWR